MSSTTMKNPVYVIPLLIAELFQRSGNTSRYKAYSAQKESATVISKMNPCP